MKTNKTCVLVLCLFSAGTLFAWAALEIGWDRSIEKRWTSLLYRQEIPDISLADYRKSLGYGAFSYIHAYTAHIVFGALMPLVLYLAFRVLQNKKKWLLLACFLGLVYWPIYFAWVWGDIVEGDAHHLSLRTEYMLVAFYQAFLLWIPLLYLLSIGIRHFGRKAIEQVRHDFTEERK